MTSAALKWHLSPPLRHLSLIRRLLQPAQTLSARSRARHASRALQRTSCPTWCPSASTEAIAAFFSIVLSHSVFSSIGSVSLPQPAFLSNLYSSFLVFLSAFFVSFFCRSAPTPLAGASQQRAFGYLGHLATSFSPTVATVPLHCHHRAAAAAYKACELFNPDAWPVCAAGRLEANALSPVPPPCVKSTRSQR